MEEKNVNERNNEVSGETENVSEVKGINVSETETLEIVTDILFDNENQEVKSQANANENDEIIISDEKPMSDFEIDKQKLQEINNRRPKSQSIFKIIGQNLKEKVSNILAIIYSSVASIISLLGLLFFTSQKNKVLDEGTIVSCQIMQVFFSVILVFSIIILVVSIIMNIIRVKKNKK